jgi:hypothetical protein
MRTFHAGGVATSASEDKTIKLKYPVIIQSITGVHVEMDDGSWLFTRKGSMTVTRIVKEFVIEKGDKLLVKDGDRVGKETPLFERNGEVVSSPDTVAIVIRGDKLLLASRELKVEIKNGSNVIVKVGDVQHQLQAAADRTACCGCHCTIDAAVYIEICGECSFHVLCQSMHNIVDVFTHGFGCLYGLTAVSVNGSRKTLDQHFTDPCHLIRGRVDTEEIANAVPNGTDPARHLIPQPRCQLLNALPQAFYDVATDIDDFTHQRAERLDDTCYDLRHCLDDFYNYGR